MEKKEQNSQKKMLTFLYTASTFLVLVILVIGVTMMNNYDRMTNMETAIHQISQTLDQESTEQNQDTPITESPAPERCLRYTEMSAFSSGCSVPFSPS